MTRQLIAVLSVIAVLIVGVGCDKVAISDNAVDLMRAFTPAARTTPLSPDDNTSVMTDFAVNLFKQTHCSGENTLVSPLSVILALAMTANGADQETLAQMERALGMPIDELNSHLSAYMAALPDDSLKIADSVWFADHGIDVNDTFLQTNADYYDADVYQAPFDQTTVDDINAWVNIHTDGMIDTILDEIPADALMYLVNALAFEAEWSEPYADFQVGEGTFTCENGSTHAVTMMHSEEGAYLEADNATGFIKYYQGRHYAFAALLPDEGTTVDDVVASLDGETLQDLLSSPQHIGVNAAMPKFDVNFDTELSAPLKAMGMVDAFDGNKADFSAIGEVDSNLFISRVLHKTTISVTEQGTVAGAATVVEMDRTAAILDPKEVILDRPFVYMLIDCDNHVPFFIGTMMTVDS